MANNGVCAGYCITVLVTSPGGRPIREAKVVCKSSGSAPIVTVQTGADGTAVIPLREDHLGAGSVPGQRGELTVTASKHHHGPVVSDGEVFNNGPAEVSVLYEPTARAKLTIQSAGTIDSKDHFLWGRPCVDAKGRLQLILIDGGTLGQNYYDLPRGASKVIQARRLTPDPDPRFPCIGVSEVDQELIFRMAHGDLALNDATRPHAFFEFEHDMSMGEFEACDPVRCKLVKQPPAPVHEPPPDLIKYNNSETAPLADRINVFGTVLAGVKILQVDFASVLAPNSREERRDSLKCSNALIVDVHPRNIVGMIRLCKRLKADYGIAAVYTAGFLRWVKGSSNYAWDSHGRGRAFDLSGVAQQMPNLPPKDGKTVTQPVRPGIDFVVYFHWGLVKLQVLTTNTASGTSTQVAERHRETGKDYSTSSASSEQLLYRLDPIPDVAARAVEFDAPRVDGESTADHLARSEDWSNDHYGACRDVFFSIWEFLTREYSHTDGLLGPLENIKQKVSGAANPIPSPVQFANAQDTDLASSAPGIGSLKGYIVHPDYPGKDLRATHNNHFHFQFGLNKVDTSKGDYER